MADEAFRELPKVSVKDLARLGDWLVTSRVKSLNVYERGRLVQLAACMIESAGELATLFAAKDTKPKMKTSVTEFGVTLTVTMDLETGKARLRWR